MNKILFIVFFLLTAVVCFCQPIVNRSNSSITVQDSRLAAQYNLLVPRYADTTAANSGTNEGLDTCGAIIFTYSTNGLWVRSCADGKKWVEVGAGGGGSGTVTSFSAGNLSPLFTTNVATATTTPALTFSLSNQSANTIFAGPTSGGAAAPTFRSLVAADISGLITTSQGLTNSGLDIQFAGAIGSPPVLTNERNLKINRQTLQFTNTIDGEAGGFLWQFAKRPYSPFQIWSTDTLPSDNPSLSTTMPLSTLFARRTVYYPASMYKVQEMYGHYLGLTFNFQDTMVAYTAGGDYNQPLISEFRIKPRNNGYSVFRTGHGTGTNLRREEGIAAFVANMYADGKDDASTDTLHINGTLVGVSPYLIAALGSGKTRIDNVVYIQPSGLINTNSYIAKSYILAPAVKYNVAGVVDSAFGYFDTARVVRSYHAGNFMIGPATSSWSSSNQLVVNGTSNFTGNVGIGVSPTVLFQVQSGGNDFLSIDPTAGAEISQLRAYNTTDDDNTSFIVTSTTNTEAGFSLVSNFNNGTKISNISGFSDASVSSLVYEADTHTFTGNVGIGVAPTVLFQVQSGGNDFLSIDPTAGAETANIRVTNTTDDDNIATAGFNTSNTQAQVELVANFNNTKIAAIEANAITSESTLAYSADTHTFTGNVGIGVTPTVLFQVQSGGNDFLSIDPTAGAEVSQLLAHNTTGGGNVSGYLANSSNTQPSFTIFADFNGGAESATIAGSSQSGSSALQYLATTHTFTGNILTATNNTYDIGDVTNSFKDIYSRTLKLDGSTSGTVTFLSDALSNAPNATTLSGRGYVPATMFSRLTSNFTMSDVNTVQPVFSTGQDVWTLQASTTYRFRGKYYLTHGAVSHSVGMSFELGGGASVTDIDYSTICWVTVANTNTASQTTNNIRQTTNTNVNAAGANAQETIIFEGWLTMNAGGTVTPSITFSTAPGGAPAAVAYSTWIEFEPIATNTATSLGNVN